MIRKWLRRWLGISDLARIVESSSYGVRHDEVAEALKNAGWEIEDTEAPEAKTFGCNPAARGW